ncbi:hypothetical protein [Pseudoxanthomonas sp. USHLN014]|uniref:hypothetical protein n=1 Tax=Pseudoxanthomonas sp. USHLN014 TaxID=3081297 RepID=UPI00301CC76D
MSNDIDTIALDVARRFTLDTEPQRRASLQVAIIEAIKLAATIPASSVGYIQFNADAVGIVADHLTSLGWATGGDSEEFFMDVKGAMEHAMLAAAPAPPADAATLPAAYVSDERGRWTLNGKAEPVIGWGRGWNACRDAILAAKAAAPAPVALPGSLDDLMKQVAETFPIAAIVRSLDKAAPGFRGVLEPMKAAPAPALKCAWIDAVDHELVNAHIGVADAADTFEVASRKLDELIRWHVAVATDPAVNGGLKLTPVATPAPGVGGAVTPHREWRSALTLAVEVMESEAAMQVEGGHDAYAARMKRAMAVMRSMITAPPAPQGYARDERAEFETYMRSTGTVWDDSLELDVDGDEQYADVETRFNYGVWLAAIAAQAGNGGGA